MASRKRKAQARRGSKARGPRHSRRVTRRASRAADDSAGAILLLLCVAWFFGYVRIEWGSTDEAARLSAELAAAHNKLAENEARLLSLRASIESGEDELGSLIAQKAQVQRDLNLLDNTRQQVATALTNVSDLVAAHEQSRAESWTEGIVIGVLSGIAVAALLTPIKKTWRWLRARRRREPIHAP